MTRTTHSLIELVHALNEGAAFYDHAAKFTSDPIVADACFRVRHVKSKIAAALAAEIAIDAEASPHKDGTWIVALRHGYADIAARIFANPEPDALAGIDLQEDRVLDAFRLIAASDPSERVRQLIAGHLADVQSMHEEITRLPHARAA